MESRGGWWRGVESGEIWRRGMVEGCGGGVWCVVGGGDGGGVWCVVGGGDGVKLTNRPELYHE